MAASVRELAVADQYVAAKAAYKSKRTAANKKKFEELKAQLIAIRNEERTEGFTVTGEEN